MQLAIDGTTYSLVTVTFMERGRDFRDDAVQRMLRILVAQRLYGDHPHLLKMQVGCTHGACTAACQLVSFTTVRLA